ncbi:MAG: RsmB/NOP family class I SAM-dependent RNA methyltransferase [Bacteroidota bacterium]
MKEKNQLYQISEAIRHYSCDKTLSYFLKSWFLRHHNMGSNDRRTMRTFVYNYFRLGKCLNGLSVEGRIAISSFLILSEHHPLAAYCIANFTSLNPENISLHKEEKLKIISQTYSDFDLKNIFPFENHLSSEISQEYFYKSFLIQPDVWIRVRKNFKENVLNELNKNKIEFTEYPEMPFTFGINNSVSLSNLKSFEKGYFEIQDLSSQKTADFFQPGENEHWWDCCAGSGGKSLLLSEKAENIKITATDTRDSILENLKERFHKASIKNFEIKNINLLSHSSELITHNYYEGIIADVPCSGSGTWSRTPEMLSCFSEIEIEKYSITQKEIIKNISPYLKNGKPLVYITCSVFKNENENIVDYVINNLGFHLDKMKLIKGYNKKADTLFAARLIKN